MAKIEEIAEEIAVHLGKPRRGAGDPRAFIRGMLQLARGRAVYKLPSAKVIKAAVERAKKALAALGEDWHDPVVLQRLKNDATTVYDDRVDRFKNYCADEAVKLTELFSCEPPTESPDGIVHSISQLIFKYATGKSPSDKGLLKACQNALERRRRRSKGRKS
jgi:hypothetical protein